ncbi:hypothetical protein LINPERHAP2_LOCUS15425, partial [Linum perenne]
MRHGRTSCGRISGRAFDLRILSSPSLGRHLSPPSLLFRQVGADELCFRHFAGGGRDNISGDDVEGRELEGDSSSKK